MGKGYLVAALLFAVAGLILTWMGQHQTIGIALVAFGLFLGAWGVVRGKKKKVA